MEDKKEELNSQSQCVICGEKIDYYSIGQCNHREICYYCTLKNRKFYNHKKCPLCAINLDLVFISPISETKTFEELSKEDLSSYYQDNDSETIGVYYTDISSMEAAMQLNAYKCPIDYCVKEEPFDTYKDLLHHLLEYHQKFYCKVCVKDGKKFISEQKLYSKSEIKEHNLYGDVEEDIPPHYKCPFCGDLYYNDEFLYKHMSNSHFMCEICKNYDKKIIFYSALPNLLQHNKLYHYCCPFKECKDVLYIAFSSKTQLIQHFENKHNQKNNNLNEKMANDNSPKILEDPTLYDISMKKDEFNFKDFIERSNKRCIQYRENKNKITNEENNNSKEEEQNHNKINKDEIEVEEDKYQYRYSNNRGERGRGRGSWRGKNPRGRGYKDLHFIKQTFNTYTEPEEINFNQIKKKELDYEFITNFFVELMKKYIINYININKIPQKEISLPKETQYQLIIIIDQIKDNKKILELFHIQNFGIEWESINILKYYLSKGDLVNENDLFKELDKLTLKNILVIYEYLLISHKKLKRSFYKYEMEEINENLYTNFFPKSQEKQNKLNGYESFSLNQNLSYIKINADKKKQKNKNKWKQGTIIGLNDFGKNNKNNQKAKKINEEKKAKKDFDKYIKQCKEEDEKLEKEKKKEKDNKEDNKDDKNKKSHNKSGLAKLMDENKNKDKNKSKNTGEFNLSNFNMDEDFPPLSKQK